MADTEKLPTTDELFGGPAPGTSPLPTTDELFGKTQAQSALEEYRRINLGDMGPSSMRDWLLAGNGPVGLVTRQLPDGSIKQWSADAWHSAGRIGSAFGRGVNEMDPVQGLDAATKKEMKAKLNYDQWSTGAQKLGKIAGNQLDAFAYDLSVIGHLMWAPFRGAARAAQEAGEMMETTALGRQMRAWRGFEVMAGKVAPFEITFPEKSAGQYAVSRFISEFVAGTLAGEAFPTWEFRHGMPTAAMAERRRVEAALAAAPEHRLQLEAHPSPEYIYSIPELQQRLDRARSLGVIGPAGEAGWKETAPPPSKEPPERPGRAVEEAGVSAPTETPAEREQRLNLAAAAADRGRPETIHDAAQAIDPDNINAYDRLQERENTFRDHLNELGQQRDREYAAAAPAADRIAYLQERLARPDTGPGRVPPRLRKKYQAELEPLLKAYDDYMAERPVADTPEMALVRDRMIAAEGAKRDFLVARNAAYRQAEARHPELAPRPDQAAVVEARTTVLRRQMAETQGEPDRAQIIANETERYRAQGMFRREAEAAAAREADRVIALAAETRRDRPSDAEVADAQHVLAIHDAHQAELPTREAVAPPEAPAAADEQYNRYKEALSPGGKLLGSKLTIQDQKELLGKLALGFGGYGERGKAIARRLREEGVTGWLVEHEKAMEEARRAPDGSPEREAALERARRIAEGTAEAPAAERPIAVEALPGEVPPSPVNLAEAKLKPPRPGAIRFYHGGAKPERTESRTVSQDYDYARNWGAGNNPVWYIDLPETWLARNLNKTYDDTGTGTVAPYAHFDVPPEVLNRFGGWRAVQPKKVKPIEEQRADIAKKAAEMAVNAGHPRDVSEAWAADLAGNYVTRAARYNGERGTPEEMFKAEAPRIFGPKQEAIKAYRPGLVAEGQKASDAAKARWADESPIKTIDDLFAGAEENQYTLAKIADRIGAQVGVAFQDPGVKGRERVQEKIDEGKAPGRINDVVRGGFQVMTPAQADAIAQALARHFEIIDEGWFTNEAGYFDRKVLVRFRNGQGGEVQIWHPELLYAKEDLGGHKLYVQYRELPKEERTGPKGQALEQRMRDLYEEASSELSPEWLRALGREGREGQVSSKAALEIERPSWKGPAALISVQEPALPKSLTVQASVLPGQRAITTGSPSYETQLSLGEATRPSTLEISIAPDLRQPGETGKAYGDRMRAQIAGELERKPAEAGKPAETDKEFAKRVNKTFAKRYIDTRPQPETLPEEYGQYFEIGPGTDIIPLDDLISSKTAEENVQGADNGVKRMVAAADGELARRGPIDVLRQVNQYGEPTGKYVIEDGNGTYSSVKRYGWEAMPAKVVGDAPPIVDDTAIPPEFRAQPIRDPHIPTGVMEFAPGELHVDAKRFQFKSGGDEQGVTDALKGVTVWDKDLSGIIAVWQDKEGRYWIADGHQRHALATRIAREDPAQNPRLVANVWRESAGTSDVEARTAAALVNIAQGTGTAVDAAKILRDAPPEKAARLPPTKALVKQGRGLVPLSPEAFGLVVNGRVPAAYAATVGHLGVKEPAEQLALLNLLIKTKPRNEFEAESIVRQGIEAGIAKREAGAQISMFGDEEIKESLFQEKSRVLNAALKTIKDDRKIFAVLTKRPETIEEAGNVLARDVNTQREADDAHAEAILNVLAHRVGPVGDALNAAARTARSKTISAGASEFVKEIRRMVGRGDLAGLTASVERGPTHVGAQNTKDIVATAPARVTDTGEAGRVIEQGAMWQRERRARSDDLFAPQGDLFDALQRGTVEMTEQGPQRVLPGFERSARQAAAAREAAGLRATRPQEAPGGLFAERPEEEPGLFQTITRGMINLNPTRIPGRDFIGVEGIRPILRLMKDANVSTLIHETGHLFLGQLLRDAAHPLAPEQLRRDAQTVLNWLGVSIDDLMLGRNATREQIARATAAHEKFAKAYEQYMRLGEAPSPRLKGVFDQFQAWLLDLYKTVRKLGHPINDDMRGVFDRMLAEHPERQPARIIPDKERPVGFSGAHEERAAVTGDEAAHNAAGQVRDERDSLAAQNLVGEEDAARLGNARAGAEERPPGGAQPPGAGAAAEPVTREGGVYPPPGAQRAGGGEAAAEGAAAPPEPHERAAGAVKSEPPAGPDQPFEKGASPVVDKIGNFRIDGLDALKDMTDVDQALRDAAARRFNFMSERRGNLTPAERYRLARASGLDPSFIDSKKIGDAYNEQEIMLLEELFTTASTAVNRAFVAHRANPADPAAVMQVAESMARLEMLQGKLAGATAEAGRSLAAVRRVVKRVWASRQELSDTLKDMTGRSLFQLEQISNFGSRLTTPSQTGDFVFNTSNGKIRQAIAYYYVNALISGPVTHARYLAGNFLNLLFDPLVKTPIAAGLGKARQVWGQEDAERVYFGEAGAQLWGLFTGAPEGLRAFAEAWRTGISLLPGEVEAQLFEMMPAAPPIGGPLGRAIGAPGRAVAGIHSLSMAIRDRMITQALAYRQATREGLHGPDFRDRVAFLANNPTPEIMDAAARETRRDLYMTPVDYDSWQGEFARLVNRNLALKVMFPIVNMPMEIVKWSAEHSPLAAVTPLGQWSTRVGANLRGENGPVARDMQAAKMLAGTAVMAVFAGLTLSGRATGDGPSNPAERATWLNDHYPNTVEIFGMHVPFAKFGGLGVLIRTAVNMAEATQGFGTEREMYQAAADYFFGFEKAVVDETFLYNLKQFVDMTFHPEEYGARNFAQWLGSWIPAASGQIARLADPYQRETRGDTFVDSLVRTAKSRIPGLSQTLLPRRDMFGEPITPDGPAASYINDPVAHTLDRLAINGIKYERKMNGIPLTVAQYDDFVRVAGRTARANLEHLILAPGFDKMSPGAQVASIHKVIAAGKKVGEDYVKKLAIGTDNDVIALAVQNKIAIKTTGRPLHRGFTEETAP